MTVPVLVLQTFPSQRSAPRSSSEQEASCAHISSSPNQVADALEAEHRVINEKRDRIDPVIGVRGARGDKRADRTGFGDSFFEDLPVFGFFVVKQSIHIDRLVELADAGINSHLAE